MWKPRRQQFNNKSSVQRKKEHSASTVNTRSTATKMPPTNNMMEAVVPPPGSASTEESYLSSAHGVMQESLARAETRAANFLRISVIVVLLLVGAGVSTGVYWYTHDQEVKKFHQRFHDDAHQVIESFHELVERNIGSSARMSAAITSSAQKANQSFPFVTIPDFELHGSHLRVQSGSHIVHYMPLVTEENRLEWEEYALKNRYQTDESFSNDMTYRSKQDSAFGFVPAPSNAATKVANSQNKNGEGHLRRLISEAAAPEPQSTLNMTILGDGTGYHPRIWRNPSVPNPGDEPDGEGPYIPAWQRRYGFKKPCESSIFFFLLTHLQLAYSVPSTEANKPSLTSIGPRLMYFHLEQ